MARELGSMEYLQKDFMRNVSHEFKTPIASIQGFAKLLQNEDLTGKNGSNFQGSFWRKPNACQSSPQIF
jgi:signal transduction histidine kinase